MILYSNIELVKNSWNVPFEIWPQVKRYFCRKRFELVNINIKSHIFQVFLNHSAVKGFYTLCFAILQEIIFVYCIFPIL